MSTRFHTLFCAVPLRLAIRRRLTEDGGCRRAIRYSTAQAMRTYLVLEAPACYPSAHS